MIKIPPTKATLQGIEYSLRNKGNWYEAYRVICLFNDNELSISQMWRGAVIILFPDYKEILADIKKLNEAYNFIRYFINGGNEEEKTQKSSCGINISFFRDMDMMVDSLNSAKDRDIRLSYMHWWTFLGDIYNHEPTGIYKTVLEIRYKLKYKKKFEPWERDFYSQNQHLIDLNASLDEKEEEFINNILGIDK